MCEPGTYMMENANRGENTQNSENPKFIFVKLHKENYDQQLEQEGYSYYFFESGGSFGNFGLFSSTKLLPISEVSTKNLQELAVLIANNFDKGRNDLVLNLPSKESSKSYKFNITKDENSVVTYSLLLI